MGSIGTINSDICAVRFTSAAHRNVEVLPRHLGRDHHVRRVCGDALGSMRSDGVAQLDVPFDVFGRKQDRTPPSTPLPAHLERTIASRRNNYPPVTVSHPGATRLQRAVVAPGDYRVSDSSTSAVVKRNISASVDAPFQDELVSCSLIQGRDGLVRITDQNRRLACTGIRTPGVETSICHRLAAAVTDAAVSQVQVDCFLVTETQLAGGVPLPFVNEPVQVDELRWIWAVVDQHRERASCVDGLQLGVIADEEHLRADISSKRGDAVEEQCARQRCFVDDHELGGTEGFAVCQVVLGLARVWWTIFGCWFRCSGSGLCSRGWSAFVGCCRPRCRRIDGRGPRFG